jgi:hypothetical protein
MKHLRNFKIFESDEDDEDDEGSKIYTGFEYSFNDIKDTLWDILDLGFTIKDSEPELWSENFIKENIIGAKWAVWQFKLEADADCKTLTKYSGRTAFGGDQKQILLNNSNLEFEVLQSIAEIRSRFGNVYHNLELKNDYNGKGWILFITIMTEIDEEEISKAKKRNIKYKIESQISTKVGNFCKKIRNIGTPKFKELSNKNKLGESYWGESGRISEGYFCIFINTTKMTNQVKTKSFQEIRDSINDLKNWNLPKESIVELRKITKEDCKKLAEIAETGIKTKEYMEERYLDLDAIVIKFNYQKWYDKLENEY